MPNKKCRVTKLSLDESRAILTLTELPAELRAPCSRGRNKAKRGSCLAKHHPRLPSAPLGVAARFAVGLGQGTAVERKCEQIEWRLACRRLLVACPVRSELHAPNRALPDDPMTVSDDPMTVF